MDVALAQNLEGEEVMKCLLRRAVAFEPHQNNMFDLAAILTKTECIQERDAFLKAHAMNSPEGIQAYEERILAEVQAMIVAARAQRLDIPRE
jgi:hypothetical protein